MNNRSRILFGIMRLFTYPIIFFSFSIAVFPVYAALEVDVVHNKFDTFSIAIGTFSGNESISEIIADDLGSTGRFTLHSVNKYTITSQVSEIQFKKWRERGTDILVSGEVAQLSNDKVSITFHLFDTLLERQLESFIWEVTPSAMRRVAHLISDRIYNRITGIHGDFSTHIAYVAQSQEESWIIYQLKIADVDGANAQTILRSPEPILSPAWSPDGRSIAYVSFEQGRSRVFVNNLFTGQRIALPVFAGVAGAPAWSPNGDRIAMSLSRSGNQDIYIYDVHHRQLERVTTHQNIDTEPEWSVDGQSIFFTSDRSLAPQVYQIDLQTHRTVRMTFSGRNNTSPAVSQDGRFLAIIQGNYGIYRVALLDLLTREETVITNTDYDESPSFSPNGRMILYATQQGNRGILATVSIDGLARQQVPLHENRVREPVWGPRLTRSPDFRRAQ